MRSLNAFSVSASIAVTLTLALVGCSSAPDPEPAAPAPAATAGQTFGYFEGWVENGKLVIRATDELVTSPSALRPQQNTPITKGANGGYVITVNNGGNISDTAADGNDCGGPGSTGGGLDSHCAFVGIRNDTAAEFWTNVTPVFVVTTPPAGVTLRTRAGAPAAPGADQNYGAMAPGANVVLVWDVDAPPGVDPWFAGRFLRNP